MWREAKGADMGARKTGKLEYGNGGDFWNASIIPRFHLSTIPMERLN
jgi:hypothetical protein